VALVTEINHEGVMTAAKGRNQIEPILRNRKKADVIVKKLGTPASLEAAASLSGQSVQKADSILFASPMIPNAGQEAKVVGAAFNKELAGKPVSPPIAGNGGVFVIKVENVGAVSNPNADVQQQRFMQEQQQRSRITYTLVDALRKLATVKDDRGKFF